MVVIKAVTTCRFKRDRLKLVRQNEEDERAFCVGRNGKGELVVQDAESYQKQLEAKDRMEAIEGIKRGLESSATFPSKPAKKFFQEFFAAESIPEHE